MVSKCSPSWPGIHEKHRSQVAKRYMMVPEPHHISLSIDQRSKLPLIAMWCFGKVMGTWKVIWFPTVVRSLVFPPHQTKTSWKQQGVKLPQQMTYQDHNIHNLKYQEELENWSSCWKRLNIRHLPLCQRLVQGAHCLESKTSLDLHPKKWIDENIHLENTRIKVTSLHLFCATSADIAVIHPIESCPKEHDIKSQEWTEQKKNRLSQQETRVHQINKPIQI